MSIEFWFCSRNMFTLYSWYKVLQQRLPSSTIWVEVMHLPISSLGYPRIQGGDFSTIELNLPARYNIIKPKWVVKSWGHSVNWQPISPPKWGKLDTLICQIPCNPSLSMLLRVKTYIMVMSLGFNNWNHKLIHLDRLWQWWEIFSLINLS